MTLRHAAKFDFEIPSLELAAPVEVKAEARADEVGLDHGVGDERDEVRSVLQPERIGVRHEEVGKRERGQRVLGYQQARDHEHAQAPDAGDIHAYEREPRTETVGARAQHAAAGARRGATLSLELPHRQEQAARHAEPEYGQTRQELRLSR